jgi:hypothetical protein
MQDLKILQRQFKRVIASESDDWQSLPICEREGFDKQTRMGIYQNGFYLRLEECLEEDFPQTFAKFEDTGTQVALIEKFLLEYPSVYANPSEYSQLFPEFLKKHRPDFYELALLEWKKCIAFVAKDRTPLDIHSLSQRDQDGLLSSQLLLHPCLQLAKLGDKFFAIYRYNYKVEELEISLQKHIIFEKLLQKKSINEILEEDTSGQLDEKTIFDTFSFLAAKRLLIGFRGQQNGQTQRIRTEHRS